MDTTTIDPRTITAVRERKGSKAVVVVSMDGVELDRLGGKRAERARAVILAKYEGNRFGVWGLRQSLPAAQTEAHRMLTKSTYRYHGHEIPCRTAEIAFAVPVAEEDGN